VTDTTPTENLFSYGTLQKEEVQLTTFGRRLHGQPDSLVGYKLTTIRIKDQAFVTASGTANHRNLEFSGKTSDFVEGRVFLVTAKELEQSDGYEPAGYERVFVQLRSGANAWVYLNAHERESQLRFEVIAALVMGILLPVLETGRRGITYWAIDFTTMFEDYVAGALLLIGGWSAYRRKSWGTMFLVLAWAYFAGLMGSSFWAQLEETLRHNPSEPNNLMVVIVKFLLWSTCVTSLIVSFRRALREHSA